MKDPRESTIHWMCFKESLPSPFTPEHVITAGFYIDGLRFACKVTESLYTSGRTFGTVAHHMLNDALREIEKSIIAKGFVDDLERAASGPVHPHGRFYPSGYIEHLGTDYYRCLEVENEKLKLRIAELECSLSEEISMEMEEEWRH